MTSLQPNTVYEITEKVRWLCFDPWSKRQNVLMQGDSFCYCGIETIRMRMPKGWKTFSGGASKHKIILPDGSNAILVIPSKVLDPLEFLRDTAETPKP